MGGGSDGATLLLWMDRSDAIFRAVTARLGELAFCNASDFWPRRETTVKVSSPPLVSKQGQVDEIIGRRSENDGFSTVHPATRCVP